MIRSDYEHVGVEGREVILDALLLATKSLHGSDVRAAVEKALGIVARVMQADAARLFRFTTTDGERVARCCVAWTAQHTPSTAYAEHVDVWGSDLERGIPLCRRADQLSGEPRRALLERGLAATILCPLVVDDVLWGTVQFVQCTPASTRWSNDEARLLQPFAEHLAALFEAKGTQALDAPSPWPTVQRRGVRSSNVVRAAYLQRRVRAERALVEASKLLVSTEPFEMEALLRIVGEATGADYAYLVTVRPDEENGPPALVPPGASSRPPIDLDAYAHYEWHAGEATQSSREQPLALDGEGGTPEGATFAVPILSSKNLLFGYLGIDFEDETSPLQDEDVRVLNVLGDMLCTYLQRRITDRALRNSEQRYRHFVDTISEAIWRIDFDSPVVTDQSVAAQVEAVMQNGSMAECNGELARLFGVERPVQLIGRSVASLTEFTGRRIVHDVVKSGFRLQRREYVVYDEEREPRYFLINTSGVVEDGGLVSVWGSTTEVTERVLLERRMVAALEQQQQRIGRDLHDSVGQLLTGMRMLAQNLEERHFGAGRPGQEQVRKIISYADEAAQHVSDLQRGLMPVQMERGGLAQALQELASNTDVLPDVDCIYVVDGGADVRDPERKLQLYRIAQEATNNALKHARPSYIKIALKTNDDTIVLEVEDDGVGFDLTQTGKESLGLHSMYYRARSIDAVLQIFSEPGSGTAVRCEITNTHGRNAAGEVSERE